MKTILLALFVTACTATKHPLEDVPDKYLHNLARIHGKTPREKLVIHHYHTFPTNIVDMMNERNRLLGEADAFFDVLNEMTTTRIESAIDDYRDPFQEEYDEIAARRRIPRVEDVIPVERETSRKRERDSEDDSDKNSERDVSPTLRIDFPGRDDARPAGMPTATPAARAVRALEPDAATRAPETTAATRAPEPTAATRAPEPTAATRTQPPGFIPIPWPRRDAGIRPVAPGPRPVACTDEERRRRSEAAKKGALTKKENLAAKAAAEAKAAAAKPADSTAQSGMPSESQADYMKDF